MHAFTTLNLRELLEVFAAPSPVPGGGAAAAMAGATGVSLLLMVARMPRTRTGTAAESAELASVAERLLPLRETLTTLIDRDATAYASLLEARRLPADDEARALLRRDALVAATREATETPLEVLRACTQSLRDAPTVAAHGARSAVADMQVAIELLKAAARGAAVTADANLASWTDTSSAHTMSAERQRLEAEVMTSAETALARLSGQDPR